MGNYDHLSEEEKKKILGAIEDSWWRSSRGPDVKDWQPPHDVLNPGSFKPQDQSLHALPAIDQTKKVSRTPGGRIESDGQFQFINRRPGDQGVKKTQGAKQMIGAFNGETHLPNLKPLDQGVTSTSIGAPPIHDVHVASQNLHVAPLATITGRPPAIDINSGIRRPGSGVPTSVSIK